VRHTAVLPVIALALCVPLLLAVPTLGQPEVFIQAKDGLFDAAGNIGTDSRQFLQGWMDRYVAWVTQHSKS